MGLRPVLYTLVWTWVLGFLILIVFYFTACATKPKCQPNCTIDKFGIPVCDNKCDYERK
jgi:hypothetical protein